MAYEFTKLSAVEAVMVPSNNANVLIEEDGVIKKAPKSAVGGGGGGASQIMEVRIDEIQDNYHYINPEDFKKMVDNDMTLYIIGMSYSTVFEIKIPHIASYSSFNTSSGVEWHNIGTYANYYNNNESNMMAVYINYGIDQNTGEFNTYPNFSYYDAPNPFEVIRCYAGPSI